MGSPGANTFRQEKTAYWKDSVFQGSKKEIKKVVSLLKNAGETKCPIYLKNKSSLSTREIWPQGYTTFSCSTQVSMKIFLLINAKMPTIVGILAFISRKNSILGLLESKKLLFLAFLYLIAFKISCSSELSMKNVIYPRGLDQHSTVHTYNRSYHHQS